MSALRVLLWPKSMTGNMSVWTICASVHRLDLGLVGIIEVVTDVTAAVTLAAPLSSGPAMPFEDFRTEVRMSRNQVRASGLVRIAEMPC